MQSKLTAKNEAIVIQQIMELPARLLSAAAIGLARGLLETVGLAQREYLSGPRPGKIQSISGRLRQGVQSEVVTEKNRIVGKIGDNVPYAAYHEFGFHGVETVKAHTRVVRNVLGNGAAVDLRRRAVSDTGEFLGFLESRKRATGGQQSGFAGIQMVRAHLRKVNYAGKPYIKPALERMEGRIGEAINAEISQVK